MARLDIIRPSWVPAITLALIVPGTHDKWHGDSTSDFSGMRVNGRNWRPDSQNQPDTNDKEGNSAKYHKGKKTYLQHIVKNHFAKPGEKKKYTETDQAGPRHDARKLAKGDFLYQREQVNTHDERV